MMMMTILCISTEGEATLHVSDYLSSDTRYQSTNLFTQFTVTFLLYLIMFFYLLTSTASPTSSFLSHLGSRFRYHYF